jgi:hypothetical protein
MASWGKGKLEIPVDAFGRNLAASKLLTPQRMPILRSASWHFGY